MSKKIIGKDLIANTLQEFGFDSPPNPSAAEIHAGIMLLILKELRKRK